MSLAPANAVAQIAVLDIAGAGCQWDQAPAEQSRAIERAADGNGRRRIWLLMFRVIEMLALSLPESVTRAGRVWGARR